MPGSALGWALSGGGAAEAGGRVAGPVGTLWLRALQMTIVPLVAALLVTGIARMVATARAGAMARRTLLTFLAVLAVGTVLAAFATPALLEAFPIPGQRGGGAGSGERGARSRCRGSARSSNRWSRTTWSRRRPQTAMLPLVVFFAALGAGDNAAARGAARSRWWGCSTRSARRCWW